MWVTQTYLGDVEPKANLFVYYLYEDYIPEHEAFTGYVQRRLEAMGDIFGDRVSLLMPNRRYTAKIGGEMRKIEGLWKQVHGKLPGLLISNEPLSAFDPASAEFTIIPFVGVTPIAAAETIDKVRRLIDKQLDWSYEKSEDKTKETFWAKFLAALELKPGIAGIRIDLKKLAARN